MRKSQVIIVWFMAICCSCGRPNHLDPLVNSSLTDSTKRHDTQSRRRKEVETRDSINNLRHHQLLLDALNIAEKKFGKDRFHDKVEIMSGNVPIPVEIHSDYHFTRANSHLIVRISDSTAVYINVFAKNANGFVEVASHEEWIMTYVNDSIRDVNGDGLKDFVVNWYGNNGCCLKAFSKVYLLRSSGTTFSDGFEFINPTFSPREKVIRGVCYGHAGETAMYKYKWNGEQIDTVEYVSYEKNENGAKTGKVIITDSPYRKNSKILRVRNSVPTEYTRIMGYDWFTGNFGDEKR